MDRDPNSPAFELVEHYYSTHKRVRAGDVAISDDFVDPDDEALEIPTGEAVVYLMLRRDGRTVVDVVWIEARPTKGGHGAVVLRDLLAKADAAGVTVKAIPLGQSASLIAWYKAHGFDGPHGDWWKHHPPRT